MTESDFHELLDAANKFMRLRFPAENYAGDDNFHERLGLLVDFCRYITMGEQ